MKTSDLSGAALDWAVAECLGNLTGLRIGYGDVSYQPYPSHPNHDYWRPSENWSQGGPILEREGYSSEVYAKRINGDFLGWWFVTGENCDGDGETLLIATMRCYVASKLGDEVDIPEELL